MRRINLFHFLFFFAGFLASNTVFAQSQVEEFGPLPATSSTEQLQLLP